MVLLNFQNFNKNCRGILSFFFFFKLSVFYCESTIVDALLLVFVIESTVLGMLSSVFCVSFVSIRFCYITSRLRNGAEGRQLDECNDAEKWLDELKDVIYRAEDLMDEIDYEDQRSKHEPESESNMSFLNKMMSSFLNKMKSKFDKTIKG